MKLQIITNLFPLPWEPDRASFNRQQFARLACRHETRITVVVAWLDAVRNRSGTSDSSQLNGMEVSYLRYFQVPGFLRASYSLTLFMALLFQARKIRRFAPDCLLLSWAYPDAVAGTLLGRLLKIPVVIKVHGSDINIHGRYPSRARQIAWSMSSAQAVISVSRDLAGKLEKLGVDSNRIHVVYNGIDHAVFHPRDKQAARRQLGLDPGRKPVVFVGNLKKEKGCRELLDAFTHVAGNAPDADLYFIGNGSEARLLQETASRAGLESRIRLVGGIEHAAVATWFNASHVVALPSYNEGVPNVLLEAMACGTPVVATKVGGIPEIVQDSSGILVTAQDSDALESALAESLVRQWDAGVIRQTVREFSWDANCQQVTGILAAVAAKDDEVRT